MLGRIGKKLLCLGGVALGTIGGILFWIESYDNYFLFNILPFILIGIGIVFVDISLRDKESKTKH